MNAKPSDVHCTSRLVLFLPRCPSCVFLIDVHVVSRSRQGQQKKLVVLRLVCEGTIEQVLYVRNTDPSFALQSHRSLVRANTLLSDMQGPGEQSANKPESHETKREDDTQVRSLDEMDTR